MRWDDREMIECMIWSRQPKNKVDVLFISTIVVHKRSSTWGWKKIYIKVCRKIEKLFSAYITEYFVTLHLIKTKVMIFYFLFGTQNWMWLHIIYQGSVRFIQKRRDIMSDCVSWQVLICVFTSINIGIS